MDDKQMQLNKMIRSFNSTYRVDIAIKMEIYKKDKGIKNLSLPEYLKRIGRLDDAIKVADKLLNYHANPLAK